MSRWTNARKKQHDFEYYTYNKKAFYKIHTGQGDFTISSSSRIDYKETIKNLYNKGYTDIKIEFLG